MIIYFSGTGNSHYIAQKIADQTHDQILSINHRIKNNNNEDINVNGNLIIVTPTYAWRIPRIVHDWIFNTRFIGVDKVWFVMNCGSEIGNADKYNRELCNQKNFYYMGTAQVIMPENYIALFDAPKNEEAINIVQNAQTEIKTIIKLIIENKEFSKPRNHLYDRFMSGPVNTIFYPLFVKSKPFHVKESCISCEKCVQLCPLNNIRIIDKKPVWKNNCTHCMACINYCPTQAIEYGKKSIHKVRYTFDKLNIR